MRRVKNIPVVKLEIPDETTTKMLEDKKINDSIWIISDVIFSIEDIVHEWFTLDDIYHKKDKKRKVA